MQAINKIQKYISIYLIVIGVITNLVVIPKLIQGAELSLDSKEFYIQIEEK